MATKDVIGTWEMLVKRYGTSNPESHVVHWLRFSPSYPDAIIYKVKQ
jgi:hypothetical protein